MSHEIITNELLGKMLHKKLTNEKSRISACMNEFKFQFFNLNVVGGFS